MDLDGGAVDDWAMSTPHLWTIALASLALMTWSTSALSEELASTDVQPLPASHLYTGEGIEYEL